ncbi:VWFA-related Acidobacterial domain protein [Luteitalea pratensis]|uniref:VWFA-related Acidobacterial domain protein n=1 Tax=Luteitalea pratensis TaxID=1855912 RepID=A0A143PVE8_LUTPR|nr:vWA domain-containing protein [Luteitalea pratensis]AMY12665.1 VWFA-related Acidobacterial domain protein [Luteitalea pratensis]
MRLIPTLVVATALGLSVLVPMVEAQGTARQRTLFVTAVGDDSMPLEKLAMEDVIVREDGVAREVLKVTPAAEPVDITVLVDNSIASTKALQDMRLGLEKFVTTFAGPHPITLMTVADRPTVQVNSTTSKAQLLKGVTRLFAQPGAGATMNEAIVEASKAIGKRKPARAAIVMITSFGPEFSDRGYQFALDALADSGATLHVLELQDTVHEPSTDTNVRDRNVVIDRGTTDTGGTRELLLANMSITDGLQKVGRAATQQFEVIYGRPETLIPARKVEVFSARPTVRVRANTLQANRTPR